MAKLKVGSKVINIGADESITIEDLAAKIIKMSGSKSKTKHETTNFQANFIQVLPRICSAGDAGLYQ